MERFGKNESNWEEFKLEFKLKDPEEVQVEGGIERPIGKFLSEENRVPSSATCLIRTTVCVVLLEVLPIVDDEMVSYERDRLQQIQENNKMLLALVQTLQLF